MPWRDVVFTFCYAGRVHSRKRNATVWCLSVCLSVSFFSNAIMRTAVYIQTQTDSREGSTRRGQRASLPSVRGSLCRATNGTKLVHSRHWLVPDGWALGSYSWFSENFRFIAVPNVMAQQRSASMSSILLLLLLYVQFLRIFTSRP